MLLPLAFSSCSNWLDVKPSDRISEDQNFSTLSGFKKSLNGVYVELNQPTLYGRTLTCDFIEVLAQRYAVNDDNKANVELMNFNYTGSTVQSRISNIWSGLYNLIANINLILKNCEEHREALPDDYYHIVRGEALALRAYLHFDLFRLFGPVYSVNPDISSIPYYKEFVLDVAPSYSCREYMQYVLNDLLEAEEELKDDPVIKYGVNGNSKDTFLMYRNLRMNYYAVQALLARAYLYMGDTENAYAYAVKVIDVQEERFPWVSQRTLSSSVIDRTFTSEVIFGLQNTSRGSLYTSYFDGQNLKMETLLAPRKDVVKNVFENETADYRYATSLANTVDISGVTYCIFNKYQDLGVDSLCNQIIPMLRASEPYLIAAETAPEVSDRIQYFSTFLYNRGLKRTLRNASDVDWYLKKEWKKEFYGEGQLFYWYKRLNQTQMQSATSAYGTKSVSTANYKLPIPDGELQYN
jgi:hypothetical protein